MIVKNLANKFFKHLENLQTGCLELVTPDGKKHVFQGSQADHRVTLHLHDWRVIKNMLTKGDIGLAEDYKNGYWDTDNLASLLTLALANQKALTPFIEGSTVSRIWATISYLFKINSIKGSRRNIHAHYDLGNDFYQLWLDPSMTYSSAIFKNETNTLTQGQYNKYDRIIEQFKNPSGSLLEIGCGWGGFADRALEKNDFSIKGITLSQEQYDYAQNRLQDRAIIALEDYRHQEGKYDKIVSIEMFEAVGEQYWDTYFNKIKSLLNENGQAIIQTITIEDTLFERYRKSGDFIRSYIFPGGMLPSPSKFKQKAEKAGLKMANSFHFGQDYARTLEIWLENFDAKYDEIKKLGFDDGFIRLWRFYLAACIAGFKTERTDVIQAELVHA